MSDLLHCIRPPPPNEIPYITMLCVHDRSWSVHISGSPFSPPCCLQSSARCDDHYRLAAAAGDNRWFRALYPGTAREKWPAASYLPLRHTPHTFTLGSPIQSHLSSQSGFDKNRLRASWQGGAGDWGAQGTTPPAYLYSVTRRRGDWVKLSHNSCTQQRTRETCSSL